MPINNIFSTWFNSWFGTWFGVWTGGWNSGQSQGTAQTKAPTKQQKFPWLNAQQIANIEKYTANLTWAEKNQEQQKLYQAMIQAIEAENFNSNRMAVNNERYMNSLSKTDPRECNFDQSACRQSALVDLVKSARNLRANTDENTVMKMFMQEMDYKWISMDKLNAYLDNGDETILYEAWLKTNQWGTKDVINQLSKNDKSWDEKNTVEKIEDVTNKTNVIWLWTEKIDEAAGKFADKWLDRGNQAVEWAADNLKSKIENMSKEEVAKYRKEYNKLVKNKSIQTAYVEWDTVLERLWNGIKGNVTYRDDDEAFMKWLVSKKANFGETLAWADTLLKWETDPNVLQMFGNIPSSALKTFTATVRGMTNPYDTMKWLYKLAATEEWREAVKSRYGSWENFAKAMNEDPVWVADDALAVAEIVGWVAKAWVKAAWKVTWNQSLLNTANKIPVVWSANDALASKTLGWTYKAMDYVWDYTDSGAIKTINRVLQDQSSLWKLAENTKKDREAFKKSWLGQALGNAKEEFINKMTWLDEADREFIRKNKKLVNDTLNWKKNVNTIYDEVMDKVDNKILEKIETWEEYEKLYKNKKKIVNTEWLTNDADLLKKLDDAWAYVDSDWNLAFKKINDFDAPQQKALQNAWEVLKDVEWEKNLNTRETLWQRRKIDNKINWEWKPEKMTTSDKVVEQLIKDMRKPLDARAKQYIPWLEELDNKYQPLIDEVRQIKKDRYNSDWTIKDNARSKIRNLTKAWNEARLERLENIAPWISHDLKALDVALTVEKATKQGVGQYSKWIIWGWATSSIWLWFINPVAWVVQGLATLGLRVLTTPKNYVKLVENYPDIASKLTAWTELLPSDVSRLQALASRIEDWMEE